MLKNNSIYDFFLSKSFLEYLNVCFDNLRQDIYMLLNKYNFNYELHIINNYSFKIGFFPVEFLQNLSSW